MRTTKFRGRQRFGEKLWLIGDKLTVNGETFIYPVDETVNSPDRYEVDPETVGEFTTLFDKVKNEIFEFDFLQYEKHPGYLMPSGILLVVWSDVWACFGYINHKNNYFTPFANHDEIWHDFLQHCTVVGNKDNYSAIIKTDQTIQNG